MGSAPHRAESIHIVNSQSWVIQFDLLVHCPWRGERGPGPIVLLTIEKVGGDKIELTGD